MTKLLAPEKVSTQSKDNLNPLLRWAGGKYNQPEIYNRLRQIYEPYRDTHIWAEPFCGACGAAFRVLPDRAILSDANRHLINLYESVNNGDRWESKYFDFDYYSLRDIFRAEDGLSSSEIATIFYMLNHMSFNGLWRESKRSGYNAPIGRNPKGELLKVNFLDTAPYRQQMKNWTFEVQPWQCQLTQLTNLKPVNREDRVIYCDPPYDGTFAQYGVDGFDWYSQTQLAKWAAVSPHPIIVSNSATDRILDLYRSLGFTIEILSAKRSINSNGKGRIKVNEMLATKGI